MDTVSLFFLSIYIYVVPLYAEAVQSSLTSSLGGIALYVCVDSEYLWEKIGSGSSFDEILDLLLRLIFFFFKYSIKFTYQFAMRDYLPKKNTQTSRPHCSIYLSSP